MKSYLQLDLFSLCSLWLQELEGGVKGQKRPSHSLEWAEFLSEELPLVGPPFSLLLIGQSSIIMLLNKLVGHLIIVLLKSYVKLTALERSGMLFLLCNM